MQALMQKESSVRGEHRMKNEGGGSPKRAIQEERRINDEKMEMEAEG